jgi:hypothetical protein
MQSARPSCRGEPSHASHIARSTRAGAATASYLMTNCFKQIGWTKISQNDSTCFRPLVGIDESSTVSEEQSSSWTKLLENSQTEYFTNAAPKQHVAAKQNAIHW